MSGAKRGKRNNSSPLDLSPDRLKLPTNNKKKVTDDIAISSDTIQATIPNKLLSLERSLCVDLRKIKFPSPVEYIYNPLEYAFNIHAMYVEKYCKTTKKILFLGINPGPWGMSQTGVPFGEINMVRDWLKISGPVGKPDREQADRKVTGFECKRSEVSGKRFWTLFQELCGDPERFFQSAYLHNYCPLALMNKKGLNITPADLKGDEQKVLHDLCDEALIKTIQLLEVEIVIGIGKYAEKRAQTVISTAGIPVQVLCIPHPSPRAVNNQNWSEKAIKKLDEFGLLQLFTD